ncbi:hypothetical protein TPA0910_12660 [Streptomyces hygroscopicus subsp. sporocinereus]|uniref:Uncharacterized protein n=1 Tax=Streptomyces hygroscopicus TaxID=1912 RepID=A0ABQ3TU86_STRHY|nr:hypothetical protein [Streptomyces hygroscopicus]GHJ26833.1 hypothetical protein TPA0910_12660 [Streptomyces hygroscopicus]
MNHELDVILTQGARPADGHWWADRETILPTRYEHADGRSRATGAPTAISALSERITPIPGRTCGTVAVDGAVTGRQWVVEPLHQHTEGAPSRRPHRRDCWQARNEQPDTSGIERRIGSRVDAEATAELADRIDPGRLPQRVSNGQRTQ